MLRAPVEGFEDWPRTRAADLRRFLVQRLEHHLEKRLLTATALARI
jgi:DNA repair protein RecO (recombination protein O)